MRKAILKPFWLYLDGLVVQVYSIADLARRLDAKYAEVWRAEKAANGSKTFRFNGKTIFSGVYDMPAGPSFSITEMSKLKITKKPLLHGICTNHLEVYR